MAETIGQRVVREWSGIQYNPAKYPSAVLVSGDEWKQEDGRSSTLLFSDLVACIDREMETARELLDEERAEHARTMEERNALLVAALRATCIFCAGLCGANAMSEVSKLDAPRTLSEISVGGVIYVRKDIYDAGRAALVAALWRLEEWNTVSSADYRVKYPDAADYAGDEFRRIVRAVLDAALARVESGR